MSSKPLLKSDVAIIGGGVTGLWLQNRLAQKGYQTVLCEARALGGGQTLASQGIIHGGIKYALGGSLTDASETIAAMPERWSACLAGEGELDLRSVRVLSESCYLWSNQGLGRLASLFASKLLRGRVAAVPRPDFPPFFDHLAFKGSLYRLHESVLDVASLLNVLATPFQNRLILSEVRPDNLLPNPDGSIDRLQLDSCDIEAETYIFAAGAGNEALIEKLPSPARPLPSMQRRPLQQIVVNLRNVRGIRDISQTLIYGHYLSGLDSGGPRLTLTSHCRDTRTHTDGASTCWYLGGQLASEGAALASDVLIERARRELARALPWFDLGGAEYQTYRVDRAEPGGIPPHRSRPRRHSQAKTQKRTQGVTEMETEIETEIEASTQAATDSPPISADSLKRPQDAWVSRHANVVICWPTKLALVPRLGDLVMAEMTQTPNGSKRADARAQMSRSTSQLIFAAPPWDALHGHR